MSRQEMVMLVFVVTLASIFVRLAIKDPMFGTKVNNLAGKLF